MAEGSVTRRFRRILPLRKKVPRGLRLIAKDLYRVGRRADSGEQQVVFIVGCQRSGTTLLTLIFERDYSAKVYGEFSRLSSMDVEEGLRLNPLNDVRETFEKSGYPLIVTKPLVETHRLLELQEYFPGSKAIWIYRNFEDVASSDLVEFGAGNGVRNLRPIVLNTPGNWRAQGTSQTTRELISEYFTEGMSNQDAAALFWYARNSLFFDMCLAENPAVIMVKYEELVTRPTRILSQIYDFIRQDLPATNLYKGVNGKSIGKGGSIDLSPPILELCSSMLERLDDALMAQRSRGQAIGETGRLAGSGS